MLSSTCSEKAFVGEHYQVIFQLGKPFMAKSDYGRNVVFGNKSMMLYALNYGLPWAKSRKPQQASSILSQSKRPKKGVAGAWRLPPGKEATLRGGLRL